MKLVKKNSIVGIANYYTLDMYMKTYKHEDATKYRLICMDTWIYEQIR